MRRRLSGAGAGAKGGTVTVRVSKPGPVVLAGEDGRTGPYFALRVRAAAVSGKAQATSDAVWASPGASAVELEAHDRAP